MSGGLVPSRLAGLTDRVAPIWFLAAALGLAVLTVGGFLATQQITSHQISGSGSQAAPDASPGQLPLPLDEEGRVDTDGDGLSDAAENLVYGSDPGNWNTSGSGIPDGWLADHGFDPTREGLRDRPATTPPPESLPDAYAGTWPDRYTATLYEVYTFERPTGWNESEDGAYDNGIDPTTWDTLGNGIPDAWLVHHGLDPLNRSLPDEKLAGPKGMTVRESYEHNTDPGSLDSDRDGIPDIEEIHGPLRPDPNPGGQRFPPTDPSKLSTVGSGACDGYLRAYGLDPTRPQNAYGDPDGDGGSTTQEYAWSHERFGYDACDNGTGSDPTRTFTGSSTIPDGWLISYDLSPLEPGIEDRVTQNASTDPGPAPNASTPSPARQLNVTLSVWDEYALGRPGFWNESTMGPWWGGSDPTQDDTDGDGLGDAWEVRGYTLGVQTRPGENRTRTYNTTSDPTLSDTDGDGLLDIEEVLPHLRNTTTAHQGRTTDAARPDTDFDGLRDGVELDLGLDLDPTRADTAGGFLLDGERVALLRNATARYGANLNYPWDGEPGQTRRVTDWLPQLPGAAGLGPTPGNDQVAALFAPDADLDGDGIPNVLDPDIDDDGLLNGWEVHPATYADSPHGLGRLQERPATDPLNPDTDGDGLRDGWEVANGIPLADASAYNLDPSRWDSDGDGVSDANEDPDGDAITWYAYDGAQDPRDRREETFSYTNELEQQYDTDPNNPDSDGDALLDGWEVFWGIVYPGLSATDTRHNPGAVYPGSEKGSPIVSVPANIQRPDPRANQSGLPLDQLTYTRFIVDQPDEPSNGLPGTEETRGRTFSVERDGKTLTVREVVGTLIFTAVDAQEAQTNPYMATAPTSTDGDGLPDAWEFLFHSIVPQHAAEATTQAGDCLDGPGTDPTTPDAHLDPDDDGLINREEHRRGASPGCRDSDLGGLDDGSEDSVPSLDPMDPGDGDTVDSGDIDGDGLSDFQEIRGRRVEGTLVKTDPADPDTDGDGLLDGPDRPDPSNQEGGWPADDPRVHRFLDLGIAYYTTPSDGFVFLGEDHFSTSPDLLSETGGQVPTGWLVAQGESPESAGHEEAYTYARPAWWDESTHGPWWGGLRVGQTAPATLDPDNDGLNDIDEAGNAWEDPMPGANHANTLRPVDWQADHDLSPPTTADPAASGLEPGTARILAQAYLNPRQVSSDRIEADRTSSPPSRQTPCLTDLHILDEGDEVDTIEMGSTYKLHGRVLRSCPNGQPVPGITVEVRLGTPPQVVGAGFSATDGSFEAPINITPTRNLTLPPRATVFMGSTTGTVNWSIDASAIHVGPQTLAVRTYATPPASAWPGAPDPRLASALEPMDIDVRARIQPLLSPPRTASTGTPIDLPIHTQDSGGSPVRANLEITWLGETIETTTNNDGDASVSLDAPHEQAGNRTLAVHATPYGSQDLAPGHLSATIRLVRPATVSLGNLPTTVDAGTEVAVPGRVAAPGGTPQGSPVTLHLSRGDLTLARTDTVTGVGGAFNGILDIPENASAGSYVLTAAAAATNETSPAETTVLTSVRGIPAFIEVGSGNLTQGDPVTLQGTLLGSSGAPLENATVTARLADERWTATTDGSGRFSIQANASLPRAPIEQVITFPGDDDHTSWTHRTTRNVLARTNLTVEPGATGPGATTEIPVQLVGSGGDPIRGAPVRVSWPGQPPARLITNETGWAVHELTIAEDHRLGPVVVDARYDGSRDGGLAPSNARVTWEVSNAPRLQLPTQPVTAGDQVPRGQLVRADGAPLTGASVHVSINGTRSQALETDRRGSFPVAEPTPANATAYTLHVTARYPGNTSYKPVQAEADIPVRPRTTLYIDAPSAVELGQQAVFEFHAATVTGHPVENGIVEILRDGEPIAIHGLTDGSARSVLRFPSDTPLGSTNLTAHLRGTDRHAPTSEAFTVRFLASATLSFRASPDTEEGARLVHVDVHRDGSPVAGTPVSLRIGNTTGGLVATTDDQGTATFRVPSSEEPRYMVARLDGTPTTTSALAGARLEPVTLEHGGTATQIARLVLLVGIPGALALAGLGVWLWRRNQAPLAPALRRAKTVLKTDGPNAARILEAYRVLEDAAIAREIIADQAPTPRMLKEALEPRVRPEVHPALGHLITLFEMARYSPSIITREHRDEALEALNGLLRQLTVLSLLKGEPTVTHHAGASR